MSDEEREKTEKFVNAAQLSRYMNVDMGEKLGVVLLNRKGGQSISKDFLDNFGESKVAIADIWKQFPRDAEKANKQWSEGNKEDALMTVSKMLFSAPARTVEKVLNKLNQKPMSVYIDTGSPFPKKAEKQTDWADVFSYSKNATELKNKIWKESQIKKEAQRSLGSIEFRPSGRGLIPRFTREGKARFDADVERLSRLNPGTSRAEISNNLIKSAQVKWSKAHPVAKRKREAREKRFEIVEESES
jgi:hypothetical protein